MTDYNVAGISKEDLAILFVDDERRILSLVEEYLSRQGYSVTVEDSGLKALELIKEKNFDVVFTDLNMPEFTGINLLTAVKERRPETEVIIVTGYGTVESAIEALKLGSYDYIQKPVRLERLKLLIDRIIERRKLEKENILIKRKLKQKYGYDELVGVSHKMQEIYEIVDRISMSNPTVLIQGESGTGKEVLARVIHNNSNRKEKPFIAVNCGAIVEGLQEGELFGHVKGAFTGAIRDNIGLFSAAEGGTIFLDEISKSIPSLQIKLLRVLQEKKIRPVGSAREVGIDVRVIAATNKDAEEDIRSGALRKDLFYRLNVVSIKIPPLKERREDIPLLANHFLDELATSAKMSGGISPEVMDILLNYSWPGNVRQLENIIERACVLGVNNTIGISDLPPELRRSARESTKSKSYDLRENEIRLIKNVLSKTKDKKAEAAELLGINVTTLYRKIKRFKLTD